MNAFYKLRITGSGITDITPLLSEFSDVWLCCEETSQKGVFHSHAYFESRPGVKQATIRKRLRERYGKNHGGNKLFSLGQLDSQTPEEYMTYLLKDGVYEFQGIPLSEINHLEKRNEEIKKEIISKRKEKKKTILQKLQDEIPKELYHLRDKTPLIKAVLQYYKDNDILVREFLIQSQIQTLLLKNDPSYIGQMAASMSIRL